MPSLTLFENRGQPRQYVIHDRIGNAFDLFAAARAEIEDAWLVAANNARRFRARTLQRHGKTGCPTGVFDAGDRENRGYFRYERLGWHDQDKLATCALVIKPFALFLAAPSLWITLSQQ
jgi:hypothetical protein